MIIAGGSVATHRMGTDARAGVVEVVVDGTKVQTDPEGGGRKQDRQQQDSDESGGRRMHVNASAV